MLIIDGSYLEGGGQIVRTALAFSTLTGIPFKCTNIRKGRKDSGLKAQHLCAIKSLQQLYGAECKNAIKGSTEIEFYPNKLKQNSLLIDIGTAGSISLLLQAILPPLLFADKKIALTIIGGTEGAWAMPIDYMQHVVLPQLSKFAKIEMNLIKRGYYPKGNGQIELSIKPEIKIGRFNVFDDFVLTIKKECLPYKLDRLEKLLCIKGISHASLELEKANVAQRQADAATYLLKEFNCPISIDISYSKTSSMGSGIMLCAIFSKKDEEDFANIIRIGADVLGERGKKAEIVGEDAAKKLKVLISTKAPVDLHLADNLVPYLALVGGKINVSEITKHTKTNIYTIERFIGPVFNIMGNSISVLYNDEERI